MIEQAASALMLAAAQALHDGKGVSIKIVGDPEWIEIDCADLAEVGSFVARVRRAEDGNVLLIAPTSLAAVEIAG